MYTDNHGEVCPAGWSPGKPTVSNIQMILFFLCELVHVIIY